jgi:hypothetical protein
MAVPDLTESPVIAAQNRTALEEVDCSPKWGTVGFAQNDDTAAYECRDEFSGACLRILPPLVVGDSARTGWFAHPPLMRTP